MDIVIKDMSEKEVKAGEQIYSKETTVNGDVAGENVTTSSERICGHNNRGYCKYKSRCRYTHSKDICSDHLSIGKCSNKECKDRHPRKCKWMEGHSVITYMLLWLMKMSSSV